MEPKKAKRSTQDAIDEKVRDFRQHQRAAGQPDPGPDKARQFVEGAVRRTRTQDERDQK